MNPRLKGVLEMALGKKPEDRPAAPLPRASLPRASTIQEPRKYSRGVADTLQYIEDLEEHMRNAAAQYGDLERKYYLVLAERDRLHGENEHKAAALRISELNVKEIETMLNVGMSSQRDALKLIMERRERPTAGTDQDQTDQGDQDQQGQGADAAEQHRTTTTAIDLDEPEFVDDGKPMPAFLGRRQRIGEG